MNDFEKQDLGSELEQEQVNEQEIVQEQEIAQPENLIAEELEECEERVEGEEMQVLYIDTGEELATATKRKEYVRAAIAAVVMLIIGLVVFVCYNWGWQIRDKVWAFIHPTPTPTAEVLSTANVYTTLDPWMNLVWRLSALPGTLSGDETVSKTQVALEFNGQLFIVGQYPGTAEEIGQADYSKYGIPPEALLAAKCVLETGTDYLYVVRKSASELYVMDKFIDTMITLAPGEKDEFIEKAIIPIKFPNQPTDVPEFVDPIATPKPTGSTVAAGEGEANNSDVGAVEVTIAPDGGGLG